MKRLLRKAAKELSSFHTSSKKRFAITMLTAVVASISFPLLSALPASAASPAQVNLSVNPSKSIAPFTNRMLGQGYGNWNFNYNSNSGGWSKKPFIGAVPGLSSAIGQLNGSIVRYAGGLKSNYVGFDRTTQRSADMAWTYPGDPSTYYSNYGTDELQSLATFATQSNADVMIEVNIGDNNPAMWADMVRYTNVEKGWNFKYWELGNELDLDSGKGVDATEYAKRFQAYQKAMLAVDPTIKIIGAAAAYTVLQNDANPVLSDFITQPPAAARAAGRELSALTYHWYEQCNSSAVADITRYAWYNSDGSVLDPRSWRNAYSRIWAKELPSRITSEVLKNYPSVEQGVTELNVDACQTSGPQNGNHIGALFLADVLPNLAYNGVDFVNVYMGYASAGEDYSLLYADNETSPTKLYARPTYSTLLMYAKYFGNNLVEATTNDPDRISIYASTDSRDPGKLKLMVVNLSASSITAPVALGGFNATGGKLYKLSSTNPTDTSANSATQNASTTINGIKIDGSNVAGSLAQIQPTTITASGTSFSYTFAPYTANIIVLDGNVGSTTPTATSTVTTTATSTTTVTRTNTAVPPTLTKTNTPVPPTATKTNTPVPPTNTNTFTFTPSFTDTTVPATNTFTNTPVPPTNTNTFTFTPSYTNTRVPATNTFTNTPVPPTNTNTFTFTPSFTNTRVPATSTFTNTPVPPTNTKTGIPATSTTIATAATPGRSKVTIYAAGKADYKAAPIMDLLVDDQVVATYKDVKGNWRNRTTQQFIYDSPNSLVDSAGHISGRLKVRFANDRGEGRDLFVDKIVVAQDGRQYTFQSEANETYSTGTWTKGENCTPGYFKSEWLHCNGYFQYDTAFTSLPFTGTPAQLPASIEAENFDTVDPRWGIQAANIAYNDNEETNKGNANYRPNTGVDLTELLPSADPKRYAVTSTFNKEWLQYTIESKEQREYGIVVKLASKHKGAKLHFDLLDTQGNQVKIKNRIQQTELTTALPSWGWRTFSAAGKLTIPVGIYKLRLTFESPNNYKNSIADVDWFSLQ